VAQAPMKASAATIEASFWAFIFLPRFCAFETSGFKHKAQAPDKHFLEGKPMLA
jgi:hypothetical protein